MGKKKREDFSSVINKEGVENLGRLSEKTCLRKSGRKRKKTPHIGFWPPQASVHTWSCSHPYTNMHTSHTSMTKRKKEKEQADKSANQGK